jgi:ABC-type branched-subunit amino acid transport system substrate-binding protein
LLFAAAAHGAAYSPGASDTEIRIGNTMPYSGPASGYGSIGKAMAAYFQMVNEGGGVNGRRIRFISLDDSYSPPKTLEQTRKLVEHEQVLAVVGTLGTATNNVIQKYLNGRGVPHLFLNSNASKWNDPARFKWSISASYNVSYRNEGKVYAEYVLQTRPSARIAVLYQNDDAGKELVAGLVGGLGERAASTLVARQSYEATDPTVDSQVISLHASGADTFVNFAMTPKHAAMAISKAYDLGWRPLQLLFSAAGASWSLVFKPAGLHKAQGIVSSLAVKDPLDARWHDDPVVRAYRAAMARHYPDGDPDFAGNFYGFMVGHLTAEVLRRCADDLTRENVLRQATGLRGVEVPMLLPGIRVDITPRDYEFIKQTQLRRFDGARWVSLGVVTVR